MTKKILAFGLCLILSLSLGACAKEKSGGAANEPFEKNAVKMDTIIRLKAYGPNANKAIDAAFKRIDEIEQIASANIATSDVCKINAAAGKEYVKVHPEIINMIKTSIEYSKLSNGAFDITVGPLIKLWGIGTENARIPSDSEIKALLPLVGYKNISINEADSSVKLLKEGMSIDLGGIAKGFTADEILKVFKKYGIKTALINLGGSTIYTLGKKPDGSLWSIGIQHPRKERNEAFLAIIKMPQQALSTSGDYERYFIKDGKRYHHILSPFTGYPADTGVMSDSIIIDSSLPSANMHADILTKTAFVLGVDKGLQIINGLKGVSCLIETTDYKVYKSSNWKTELQNFDPEFKMAN